ncbi:PHB depolymerase family esterase [Geodermatophilus sp. DSM 44513]|uniref:alpha/beta hydrolase family esterase n=1 Tax=Geodermatophilus sp. DSM 44513 TaxID=1528104 RepID=UPI00127A06BF|nr:PHB depolymerase family esterase [Geodermatophilus sp. DSM 44513]WNV75929.1 PHB depolymerase family esterase [Geodermatophilus sp. DSM 44513]
MTHLSTRRRTLVVLAAAVVVGSGVTTATAGGDRPADGGQRAAAGQHRDGGEAGGGGCRRADVAGDLTLDVTHEGVTYPVAVYVPGGLPADRVLPLVLNLHGSTGNGPQQMDVSELRPVADREGFVVAAPSGAIPLTPRTPPDPAGSWAWNVPGVPTTENALPPADARDDVAFLGRVADVVSDRLCTDDARTYATGYSGGGRMASTLACRTPERVAAIAPVAGLRAGRPDPDDTSVPEVEDCRPDRPVPVVTFHGQQDAVNPYDGSPDLRWGYDVPLAVQTWARLDGCRVGPDAVTVSPHVTRLGYTQCDGGSEVQLYRVSDGGHTWPGTEYPTSNGTVTQEIEAAEVVWDFFEDHRLPSR